MAKPIFNLSVALAGRQESIVSVSRRIVDTFYSLSLFDPIFGNLKVIAQPKGFYKSIVLGSDNEEKISELSKAILNNSLPDIREYDGTEIPILLIRGLTDLLLA